ncbi:MAG: M18 family aminopeptidase [Acidimicrobiia bacterium]|nr:M18 family aminopeptidase [Acidimicrobiia bacterium]
MSTQLSTVAAGVLADLDRSPTPYHAVERAAALLAEAGFAAVDESQPLPPDPGGRFLVRGGSLIAWWQSSAPGFCIVGAHTDSPNLRVRTKPDVTSAGFEQVGMEVYGGVLLNSWLDRDLGLAGRVSVEVSSGTLEARLYCDAEPILRVPQLAIHLDREISERGLKLDPQRHLTPLWALDRDDRGDGDDERQKGQADPGRVRAHVAAGLGVAPSQILAWDLMAFDTQSPAVVGRDGDLFASGRIDNLVSASCGVRALIEAAGTDTPRTPVLVLYDHEEIGSQTATGAAGPLLGATLERIAAAGGGDRTSYLASLAASLVVSADGAHATHPNYVDRHEPSHHIALNKGVVIKRNANQRYATDAGSEAEIVAAAAAASVPLQYYIHRNDLPCGSTIGPITAARLGIPTVDLGAPQLAMHSARETAGLADLDHLHDLLAAVWRRS